MAIVTQQHGGLVVPTYYFSVPMTATTCQILEQAIANGIRCSQEMQDDLKTTVVQESLKVLMGQLTISTVANTEQTAAIHVF